MIVFFKNLKLKWDIYKLQNLIKKLEKPSSIDFTPLRYKYSSVCRYLIDDNNISNPKNICSCERCPFHSINKIKNKKKVIILIY
jgi:selenophosphate synthetase-related protein